MKCTLRCALAGFFLAAALPASAAINFVGVTLGWNEGASNDPATRTTYADTIGGNQNWNAYVGMGGSLLNSGDGADTRFSVDLEDGVHNFSILVNHSSWVDNSPTNPGSFVNLFFGDRSTPGISAKLLGGNSGALSALTMDDFSSVINDMDGSMVAPSGSLSAQVGLQVVSLTGMSMGVVDDTVGAWKALPNGTQDSMISLSLSVVTIPEPSGALLLLAALPALALRRRRK